MRPEKRQWIYSGLSVPPKVALVRPARPSGAAKDRVLLAGGAYAAGIAVPLSVLSQGVEGAQFRIDLKPEQSAYAWARFGWLESAVREFLPTSCLLAVEPFDPSSAEQLSDICRRTASSVIWLPPPGGLASKGLLSVPAPVPVRPSAQYYATWAGAAWAAI